MPTPLSLDPLGPGSESSRGTPTIKPSSMASEDSFANEPPFMRSTWHKNPANRSINNPFGWLAYRHMFKGEARPREGKSAVHSLWKQHAFIFPRAIAPMVIQYISMKYFRLSWPMWVALIVYSATFIVLAAMITRYMNSLALKYGFLDGKVPRNGIPDARLKSTLMGLLFVTTVRPLFYCLAAYDRFEMPYITPWLPVHMFLYTTIYDFWFYIYHRAMHEVDFLWRFHKTHHMAKHPNALLSAFSDPVEEVFGFLIIPLLTYVTYPVDFFTLWITSVYILYSEVIGHSGIRVYQQQPVTGPVLRPFGMDIIGEDHDLHHRNGWRESFNYGKQTRVWDKLFGTMRPRMEMVDENVDW